MNDANCYNVYYDELAIENKLFLLDWEQFFENKKIEIYSLSSF